MVACITHSHSEQLQALDWVSKSHLYSLYRSWHELFTRCRHEKANGHFETHLFKMCQIEAQMSVRNLRLAYVIWSANLIVLLCNVRHLFIQNLLDEWIIVEGNPFLATLPSKISDHDSRDANVGSPPLTFSPIGRLGNRMFQYASLQGIASRLHRTPQISHPQFLTECFESFSAAGHDICPTSANSSAHPSDLQFSPWSFHLMRHVTCLRSLMQSWRYFGHVSCQVRKSFAFRSQYREAAENWLRTVSEGDLIVSIQVRRTDFINTYSDLMTPITPQYILNAMRNITAVFGKVTFVVTSDDMEWSKRNIHAMKFSQVHFMQNSSPCTDLAVLSKVNHSIITAGSSFAWWGAFLANGHVTYFPKWLKHGGWYNLKMVESDYYLPHWTLISREWMSLLWNTWRREFSFSHSHYPVKVASSWILASSVSFFLFVCQIISNLVHPSNNIA